MAANGLAVSTSKGILAKWLDTKMRFPLRRRACSSTIATQKKSSSQKYLSNSRDCKQVPKLLLMTSETVRSAVFYPATILSPQVQEKVSTCLPHFDHGKSKVEKPEKYID